jgi:glycosyltransferase involved in cell wall biosynthesis
MVVLSLGLTDADASTPTSPPSFAVVIPAYNEGSGVVLCVREVAVVLAGMAERNALIVVDDGSSDETGNVLDAEASDQSFVVVHHAENRGYGGAIQTGVATAAAAGFDYVLFMDSDLTNDPRDIPRLVERMTEGTDVIKASRYVRGGGHEGVPRWRVALSVLGNTVARALFRLPLRDCTNGFRAVRTNLLAPLELRENGFAVILEELYRLRPIAHTYSEVPVVLTTRPNDRRPSVFSYTPRSLWRFLRYPVLSALDSLRGRS